MDENDFVDELFGYHEEETPVVEETQDVEPEVETEVVEEPVVEDTQESETTEEYNPQVPYDALKAERAKHKAQLELERRKAEDLEVRLRYYEAQNQQNTYQPSVQDDPIAYYDQKLAQMQAEQENIRLNQEAFEARQKFGEETLQAAANWAAQRLGTDVRLQSVWNNSPNRIEAVIQEYQNDQLLERYRTDPDSFIKTEYETRFKPVAQTEQEKPKILSEGINRAPSKGSMAEEPIPDPIDALFDKKR